MCIVDLCNTSLALPSNRSAINGLIKCLSTSHWVWRISWRIPRNQIAENCDKSHQRQVYVHICAFYFLIWYPKMKRIIASVRADDCARLKDRIATYVPANPAKDLISPPIQNRGSSCSHLGVNHPVLACFLCSITRLKEFEDDPDRWVVCSHYYLSRHSLTMTFVG